MGSEGDVFFERVIAIVIDSILLRAVDFVPAFYILDALVMVITERSQRIGDVGADTIVARVDEAQAES